MSDDKKASFKEFGQVSVDALELRRQADLERSFVENMKGEMVSALEAEQDAKMARFIDLNEKISTLYEMRGHHDACEDCPLSLVCLAGRNVGNWCSKCLTHFAVEIDMFVECDAIKVTGSLSVIGACPKCDNGVKKETFKGVQMLGIGDAEILFGDTGTELRLRQAAAYASDGIKTRLGGRGLARRIFELQHDEDMKALGALDGEEDED